MELVLYFPAAKTSFVRRFPPPAARVCDWRSPIGRNSGSFGNPHQGETDAIRLLRPVEVVLLLAPPTAPFGGRLPPIRTLYPGRTNSVARQTCAALHQSRICCSCSSHGFKEPLRCESSLLLSLQRFMASQSFSLISVASENLRLVAILGLTENKGAPAKPSMPPPG